MLERVDILILHGKSANLVAYLKDIFSSLGIHANTVLGLPSRRKVQEQRVEHYIKHCRIALILATFDEIEPRSKKARPNVYDEIARCRRLKRKDTMVLRERRGRRLVELGSNVDGQLVLIEFEQDRIHLMLPALITEIRNRGLLSVGTYAERKSEAGHILNRFLDQMDGLWDNEFDQAWDNVHRKDYHAERNFAVFLDQFFQQYQNVFSGLIREKKTGDELVTICNIAYAESHKLAARAWEVVAEAKMQEADNGSSEQSDRRRNQLEKAATLIKNAKRISDPTEKIRAFRTAIKLLMRI